MFMPAFNESLYKSSNKNYDFFHDFFEKSDRL